MDVATLDTSTDPQVGFRPSGALGPDPLGAYRGEFNVRHAAHLLRRAGFGGTPDEITRVADLGTDAAVTMLLHPNGDDVAFADYPPTDALYDPKTRNVTAMNWWLDRMLRTRQPLREKVALFWHGRFATALSKVDAVYMVEQIDLFRQEGLGRFPALLSAVTRDPAMLIWLDNRYNAKAHPNENYAREVMELFTLGLGNYSETDVREAARAFTGWTLDKTGHAVFDSKRHDEGSKTLLGSTGAFGTDDVIALIVSQPIHQRFLARKLLEFFVYSDPEPELTEAVAQVYALSGFDIAKTLGTVFRSNVFFSPRAYRAVPKAPIEFAIGTLRYMGVQSVPPNLAYQLQRMGQQPLNPPTVKGWDGGPTWINTSTLLARFNFVNGLITQTAPGKNGVAAVPAPNVSPDDIVRADGMNAPRIAGTLIAGVVQDDVTSDVRATLVDYLDSRTPMATAQNPMPLGPENYQDKIRGALALTLNLPVNQLN